MSDQEKKTTEKEQQGKERTGHAKSTQKKRRPNPEHPSTVEHKKKKTTGTAQKEPARKKRTADHETRKAVGEEHKKTHPSGGKKHKAPVEISEPVKWDLDDSGISVSDDLGEERTELKTKKKGKALKKVGIVLGCVVGVIALIYLGGCAFFSSHFYYGTEINEMPFSMKSVSAVENSIKSQVKGYALTVEEKDGVKETISGSDISLTYKKNDSIEKALKSQNAFLWPQAFFKPSSADIKVDVSYDKDALNEKIQQLKCISEVEQTEPQSAYPKFDGNEFVVEPEVLGNKVDQDVLNQKIHDAIAGFQSTLNMEEEKCYALPKYTSESKEVQAACDTMNQYCKASITYTMGSTNEVVDKALISTWLTYDENMNVTFNTDAVTQYMKDFGQKYDTIGKKKSITAPNGKTAEVSGGTYGWSIDEATEAQNLINSIQTGEVVSREPAYAQTAASHDGAEWGNTYIEVDLTAQHMWVVSGGAVSFETDVVTGLPTPERQTPQGVYSILEKKRNKTLRGEKKPDGTYTYETPVSYWLRVTWTGVGFHDATWQPYFGGTRYQTNGSHGCINMAYSDVATLYDLVEVGTPVIMHY